MLSKVLAEKAEKIREKSLQSKLNINLNSQATRDKSFSLSEQIASNNRSEKITGSAHNQQWSAECQALICKITKHIDSLSITRHDQFYTDLLDEIDFGPDGQRVQSGELKKLLTVMSILIDQGKANNTTALQTHVKIVDTVLPQQVSWNLREISLIEWYRANRSALPLESYQLSAGVYVSNPSKFYTQLDREIENGYQGPRARTGALQDDLEKLKSKLEGSK